MVLAAFVIAVASVAFTNANTVPTGHVDDETATITPNNLKPADCAALNLSRKISTNGNVTGTGFSELITGSANANTLSGSGGSDCLVGGDGNDTLNGGAGIDVCIGGGGFDTFNSCSTAIQ